MECIHRVGEKNVIKDVEQKKMVQMRNRVSTVESNVEQRQIQEMERSAYERKILCFQ